MNVERRRLSLVKGSPAIATIQWYSGTRWPQPRWEHHVRVLCI